MKESPEKTIKSSDEVFPLSAEQIAFFRENGFVKLKNVLSPEELALWETTVSNEVRRLNTQHLPLEQRDTYGKAFLQITNIWTQSPEVRELVFSKRLARIAAELMEVSGVRMYHDQALFKEPGGGITPWHADQYYWPLSSEKTVTAWIPLQNTPMELGPLEFSAGSNRLTKGRGFKISDESQNMLERELSEHGFTQFAEPFEPGEVSFHTGWLYHRAGVNSSKLMRKLMTVIYMDKDMRLIEPQNEDQVVDRRVWCPGVEVGEVIGSEINPVLWQKPVIGNR